MSSQDNSDWTTPHRRWNPLLEEWVLVSPHRSSRPWQGAVEKLPSSIRPKYDDKCYLCPGNKRTNGDTNPKYEKVFSFNNDFSAVLPSQATGNRAVTDCNGLIRSESEGGICRVICFSPRHDLTLADMSVEAIQDVIGLWGQEYLELGGVPFINHVMTFENKGEIMGCSNPHPHGQIWATTSIPNLPERSLKSQCRYYASHGSSLLVDYLKWELSVNERVIFQNGSFAAVVPYWAVWPFEVLIAPLRSVSTISDLSNSEKIDWAAMIKEITSRYDRLFECSFPYSMGVYQKPTDKADWLGSHLHQIFLPPLLRSATIKKFMVGFELCASPQRDITPEAAAQRLRGL